MAISRRSSAGICTVVGVSRSRLPTNGRSSQAICRVVSISARTRAGSFILLEGTQHRRVEHLPRLEPEFEAGRTDPGDEIRLPGQQAETRADGAVFVKTCRADIDAELEHAGLTKTRRPDPRAAGVVHIDQGALVMGDPDD